METPPLLMSSPGSWTNYDITVSEDELSVRKCSVAFRIL